MNYTSKLLLSASALFLFSCSGGENNKYNEAANPGNPPAATMPAGSSNPAAAGATNPEHGQPNHRCDIPVGAPLSTPMQPNLQPVVPKSSQQAQGGANPPHGMPGHVCSEPVGNQ